VISKSPVIFLEFDDPDNSVSGVRYRILSEPPYRQNVRVLPDASVLSTHKTKKLKPLLCYRDCFYQESRHFGMFFLTICSIAG
jgi:hypothetical protein